MSVTHDTKCWKGWVPAAPIRALVRTYIDQNNVPRNQEDTDADISTATMPQLAEKVGLKYDSLQKILAGRSRCIKFNIADNLMCAMGVQHLWRDDPELRESYESVYLDEGEDAAWAVGEFLVKGAG